MSELHERNSEPIAHEENLAILRSLIDRYASPLLRPSLIERLAKATSAEVVQIIEAVNGRSEQVSTVICDQIGQDVRLILQALDMQAIYRRFINGKIQIGEGAGSFDVILEAITDAAPDDPDLGEVLSNRNFMEAFFASLRDFLELQIDYDALDGRDLLYTSKTEEIDLDYSERDLEGVLKVLKGNIDRVQEGGDPTMHIEEIVTTLIKLTRVAELENFAGLKLDLLKIVGENEILRNFVNSPTEGAAQRLIGRVRIADPGKMGEMFWKFGEEIGKARIKRAGDRNPKEVFWVEFDKRLEGFAGQCKDSADAFIRLFGEADAKNVQPDAIESVDDQVQHFQEVAGLAA